MSVGMGDDLLGPLAEWPDVLREHVLKKLNPTDLSLLSLTNKRLRAAVEESGRPVAGDIHCLELALFMGSNSMARWAWSNANCPKGPEVSMHLAWKGDVDAFKRANELGWPWNEWTCREFAHQGRLDMLIWARERGCPWDTYTTVFAARAGHLPTLRWAFNNGAQFTTGRVVSEATKAGHLHVLKWMHANRHVLPGGWLGYAHELDVLAFARMGGHTEVVEWLMGFMSPNIVIEWWPHL